ncbi:MAG: hypothetical protein M5U28_53025 [Sandaracinaceae bacterium]|nr:hypothetical protein [Sandaracinaceae bacterium]
MLRWVCIAALLLTGCYESHRLVYEGPQDSGGGRIDAWSPLDVGPPPIDVGPPPFDVGPPPIDAGRRDSGTRDSGLRDSGTLDAGRRDSGTRDSGTRDSGTFDAGPPRDSGPRDSGTRDSGPRDSGPLDSGPPPIDAGPDRPALRFSRSTFFGVGDAPSFDLANDSSFEVWVRSRETGDIDYCGKGDSMARDLIVGQRAGVFVVGWRVGVERYLVDGPMVPFDTWTHIAVVRRLDAAAASHAVELYVNGVFVNGATFPRLVDAFNDRPFRCGFANADVDEVRLWRVARSGADIAANRGRRISGGIPGLLSYWRLDERGQILTDYTAMGRVGILGFLTTPDPGDGTWIVDGAI